MSTGEKQNGTVTVPAFIQAILAKRGILPEDMGKFLAPSYTEHLHDPFLLLDMQKAVDRIMVAAARGERVVVYGDYDIDGITASAILIEGLDHLGIQATSYIPDRFEEGYGINLEALQHLKTIGVELVVSVDCGITSVREAAWAQDNGLDLIITDHHAVPEVLPEAIAVINPKRPGNPYPFSDLCGAGVAFKLVQALQRASLEQPVVLPTGEQRSIAAGQEKWLLDLVALGTVCDIVTLVDENRVLVTYGLQVMRRTRRPGLRALANIGGVAIDGIGSQHLGFVLGPRMNAAGRLEHAARSVELVMTRDEARAATIAQELDTLNSQRRATQTAVYEAADKVAEQYTADPVLLLAHPEWSHGIVGIVASKLVEKWHKPVLVAQVLGDSTKGSARSVPGFNIVEALRAQSDMLTKFGGHFFAAGYTLETQRVAELRERLNAYFKTQGHISGSAPGILPEAEISGTKELSWQLQSDLALLEPFGAANPEPILAVHGVTVAEVRRIGAKANHLRLKLRDETGAAIAAIGFGMSVAHPTLQPGQRVTAVGTLGVNEWQGTRSLQLQLKELKYA